MRPKIADVLADCYASTAMCGIWSNEGKIVLERQLWIAILRTQQELGMRVSSEAIEAYERVVEIVNLESILQRELETRHDVKARIEEFNALAGYEFIHTGMTSRDLTENVEQMQIRKSMAVVHQKSVAILGRLAKWALEYDDLPIAGRTHNVAAQMITVGKRFSMWAEELEQAFMRLHHCRLTYPLRGIKGPVGTQLDMLALLGDLVRLLCLRARWHSTSASNVY